MDISSSANASFGSALMVASLAKKAADPGRRIRTETAGNSSAIRSGCADIGQRFPRSKIDIRVWR